MILIYAVDVNKSHSHINSKLNFLLIFWTRIQFLLIRFYHGFSWEKRSSCRHDSGRLAMIYFHHRKMWWVICMLDVISQSSGNRYVSFNLLILCMRERRSKGKETEKKTELFVVKSNVFYLSISNPKINKLLSLHSFSIKSRSIVHSLMVCTIRSK